MHLLKRIPEYANSLKLSSFGMIQTQNVHGNGIPHLTGINDNVIDVNVVYLSLLLKATALFGHHVIHI